VVGCTVSAEVAHRDSELLDRGQNFSRDPVRCLAERGPQPLAAAEHEVAQYGQHGPAFGAAPEPTLLGQEGVQDVVDGRSTAS
jgi:hypothetical protein